jgi:hypothetical protein
MMVWTDGKMGKESVGRLLVLDIVLGVQVCHFLGSAMRNHDIGTCHNVNKVLEKGFGVGKCTIRQDFRNNKGEENSEEQKPLIGLQLSPSLGSQVRRKALDPGWYGCVSNACPN